MCKYFRLIKKSIYKSYESAFFKLGEQIIARTILGEKQWCIHFYRLYFFKSPPPQKKNYYYIIIDFTFLFLVVL